MLVSQNSSYLIFIHLSTISSQKVKKSGIWNYDYCHICSTSHLLTVNPICSNVVHLHNLNILIWEYSVCFGFPHPDRCHLTNVICELVHLILNHLWINSLSPNTDPSYNPLFTFYIEKTISQFSFLFNKLLIYLILWPPS